MTEAAAHGAVVGHIEWVTFMTVERVPVSGEIVHARDWWEEPGGGGAGAAAQMAKLGGVSDFFTAVGNDEAGERAVEALTAQGVCVHAAVRDEPTRRAFTFIEDGGERTITVAGRRLEPAGRDALPWDELDGIGGVYVTAGDEAAFRHARRARVVVSTARILASLRRAAIRLDGLVSSATDRSESYTDGDLEPRPRLVVTTHGEHGGTYDIDRRGPVTYAPAPPPGPIVDRYGAGDSFAAGLAYGLGVGMEPGDAVGLAARCGAAAVTGRGPYAGQLRL